MSLIVSLENYKMSQNDKSDLAGPDSLDGLALTGIIDNNPIIARPLISDKGSIMSQGFKVLPHSFVNSHIWAAASFKYRSFIIELLSRCCWKKTPYILNGHSIELQPGQFACSTRKMADLFSPKEKKGATKEDRFSHDDIRGAIHFFTNHKILTQSVTHQITILTFSDPDIYGSNFNFNPTVNPTAIPQCSHSHLKQPFNHLTKEESSPQPLMNEGHPPISPKGDLAQKEPSKKVYREKRVPAEKFQREAFVRTTKLQHDSLVEKHGEVLVSFFYKKLSTWKIGKGIGDRPNDYLAICNWVIKAVLQEMEAPSSPLPTTNWDKNQIFIREVMQVFPEKTHGMYFFHKDKVLRHKGHSFDLSGEMPHDDFTRLVCKHLKISMEIANG